MATNGKRKRYTGAGISHHHAHNQKGEDDFGNQTLPVAQLPDDFDGIPADGSVYLAMVRQEAVKYPSIFLAPSNPYALAPKSYVQPASRADALGIPGQAWRDTFLARFLAMREALSHTSAEPLPSTGVGRFPRAKTTEGASRAWYRFLFRAECPTFEEGDGQDVQQHEASAAGPDASQQAQHEEEVEDEDGLYNDAAAVASAKSQFLPLEPTPVLLAHFNISQILTVLNAMPYWIALRASSRTTTGATIVSSTAATQAIDPLLSRWCFSLLGKLDRRLTSDEISILRVLARACIAAIALKRSQEETEGHTDPTGEGEIDESGAWIVVAIVAGVWGQSDLWMDAEEDLGRLAAVRT